MVVRSDVVYSCSVVRPRERAERPVHRPPSPTLPASPTRRPQQQAAAPQVVVSRMDTVEAIEDGHRRKKVAAGSPRVHPSKSTPKLYNPDADPVPMRRTAEPDVFSETASSSYGPRHHLSDRGAQHGRLFDFRKDDPVRFNVLRPTPPNGNRPSPTPKSSGEYVSASSTSSYAHSITSSSFTLSSTTDGSSASSALFDGDRPREHANSGAFAQQLKKLYRGITTLESRLLMEDGKEPVDEGRTLKRPNEATSDTDESEQEKWQKFVKDHKQ